MSTLACQQCRRNGLFFKAIRAEMEKHGIDIMDIKYGGEIMKQVEEQLRGIQETEHRLRSDIEMLSKQVKNLGQPHRFL